MEISYSIKGGIATITMNRPERLNSIFMAMPRETAAAVVRAREVGFRQAVMGRDS